MHHTLTFNNFIKNKKLLLVILYWVISISFCYFINTESKFEKRGGGEFN